MSECQNCGSFRVVTVQGKIKEDQFTLSLENEDGDVLATEDTGIPEDLGIGAEEYLDFSYCLECGQVQGNFPLDPTELEESDSSETQEEEGSYDPFEDNDD